jgi:cytochrome c biogenesis protein CcdA
MNRDLKEALRSLLGEMLVYTALVVSYVLLVLHYSANWLNQLFRHDRKTYALVALLLMVVQGLVLERLTRALLSFRKWKRHK